MTGERMSVWVRAKTVQDAELMANDAGWLVLDPSEPLPPPSPDEIAAASHERAVMYGTLKALGIAAAILVGIVVLGNIAVFLASQS